MDKYIKAVLAADSKVIIPRFGCLLEPSEEPGILSFNPYLNFDDGKLTAAICAGEGVGEQQAVEIIAKFVDDYNNKLSDGETVAISAVGSFKKSEDGRVEFTQSADYKHGNGDISLGMGVKLSESLANGKAEDEVKPEVPEEKDGAAETAKDERYPETDRWSRWPLVLLIIAALLIAMWLLLFVFFKDNAVYNYFNGGTIPATEQAAPATPADTAAVKQDTAAADKTKKTEAAPAKAKPAPTVARALESRYNVIVGSYKEEATAIKRVESLHAKGYTDAFVGIRKDYYVAVIKDFTSITQAEAYQEEIVDGPEHIESWITNSGENGR